MDHFQKQAFQRLASLLKTATELELPPEEFQELQTEGFTCVWTNQGGRGQSPNIPGTEIWAEQADQLWEKHPLPESERSEFESDGDMDEDMDPGGDDTDSVLTTNVVIAKDSSTAGKLADTRLVGNLVFSEQLGEVTIQGEAYGVFGVGINWGPE